MKIGDLVKDGNGRIGTSRGPTVVYGVKWIMVEWKDGGTAIVLEEFLEVVSESR